MEAQAHRDHLDLTVPLVKEDAMEKTEFQVALGMLESQVRQAHRVLVERLVCQDCKVSREIGENKDLQENQEAKEGRVHRETQANQEVLVVMGDPVCKVHKEGLASQEQWADRAKSVLVGSLVERVLRVHLGRWVNQA